MNRHVRGVTLSRGLEVTLLGVYSCARRGFCHCVRGIGLSRGVSLRMQGVCPGLHHPVTPYRCIPCVSRVCRRWLIVGVCSFHRAPYSG